MKRVMLVAFTVDDHNDPLVTDADMADGIRARLDEFYPTDDGYPYVPTDVQVTVRAHHFANPTEDTREICVCGAEFVEGFNLHAVKLAHLAAFGIRP